MTGEDLVEELRRKFRVGTDVQLADFLGVTAPGVRGWRMLDEVTPRIVANIIEAARKRARKELIHPIAEFFSAGRRGIFTRRQI